MFSQDYFEIRDLPLSKGHSWITLREITKVALDTLPSDVIEAEIFVGTGTAAVFLSEEPDVDKMGWEELGIQPHRSGPENWGYHEADVFRTWKEKPLGINLVIAQYIDEVRLEIWHLHPDLVVGLGLVKEGDSWFRPQEGWIEVVRLARNAEGGPSRIEIRSEFLKDYLCARGLRLFCSTYSERIAVSEKRPAFSWSKGGLHEKTGRDTLEATTRVGGFPHKSGTFWTRGAIWRTEWVDAGKLSTRIRGDKDPQEIAFAVDNDGTRANAGQLTRDISWLYFQPTIASMVMRYRGSHLHWYSGETGALGATAGSTVHFGVNDLGLITVLAKDIGQLPQWQQRLWSAHNVTPEGEVSSELFEAQMMLIPASTKAPEGEVQDALNTLDASFKKRYGTSLLREHSSVTQLLRAVHRFRAVEEGGLLDLSKDLMRLFSERVDVDALTPHFTLANSEKKPGSLKAMEKLLAGLISIDDAKAMMSPLFGINDLRGASAHLGTSLIGSGMERAEVDDRLPLPMQGRQLIQSFVNTIKRIEAAISLR